MAHQSAQSDRVPPRASRSRPRSGRSRLVAGAVSVAVHAGLLGAWGGTVAPEAGARPPGARLELRLAAPPSPPDPPAEARPPRPPSTPPVRARPPRPPPRPTARPARTRASAADVPRGRPADRAPAPRAPDEVPAPAAGAAPADTGEAAPPAEATATVSGEAGAAPPASVPAPLVPPRKVKAVRPAYPAALRALGLEADVVLRVIVGAAGRVTDVAVLEGAGHAALDAAAVAAARAEVYAPATRDGEPVPHGVRFTVRFRISDS